MHLADIKLRFLVFSFLPGAAHTSVADPNEINGTTLKSGPYSSSVKCIVVHWNAILVKSTYNKFSPPHPRGLRVRLWTLVTICTNMSSKLNWVALYSMMWIKGYRFDTAVKTEDLGFIWPLQQLTSLIITFG